LDVPAKVGRAHKEDKADASNGYFDCKVLSRQHSLLMFEEGKFFLMDTGSSNGSFINNIRLSKSGEESKITEIFTGDVIRFGSDVVDKARNVTQKCIVAKLKMYLPNGLEVRSRPPESRLFRPTDSFEDIHTITMSLQESLSREKVLEDRLVSVRNLTSKHIGRSQTDLTRVFEKIKVELSDLYEERQTNAAADIGDLEKVLYENKELCRRLEDIEKKLDERELFCSNVAKKQQEDTAEINSLTNLCERQRVNISNLETALGDTQADMDKTDDVTKEDKKKMVEEYEEKIFAQRQKMEGEFSEMETNYTKQMKETEDNFAEERTKIRQQLHEVTSNEINLLNRIKSLESEQGYARAEVDKIVVKDQDNFAYKQELEYRVECLETELAHARQQLEAAEASKVVVRAEEDIAAIAELQAGEAKLKEDVAYVKKELIDARSRKAAAEDELNTVKGSVETMINNINSLTNEGENLKKSISELTEKLAEKTREAEHLSGLLASLEAQPGQDEKAKIQIADLRAELAAALAEVKARNDEILDIRNNVRLEREVVQQKDIEISRLNGQVQFMEEEMTIAKNASGNVDTLQAEINLLRNKMNLVVDELEVTREDNTKMGEELHQQQVLYTELKKMRGRGEEFDLLQQAQRDVVNARGMAEDTHCQLMEARDNLNKMAEEKMRIMREMAQLRSSTTRDVGTTNGGMVNNEPIYAVVNKRVEPHEALFSRVGSLKIYEVLLGILFISVMISWNFVPDF